MLSTPFLTDLDSRAAVKGSRDPLGIQSIWTRLGRHVVGNLTTVTNSVRDFTTTLLGYYFAERVADDVGPGTADSDGSRTAIPRELERVFRTKPNTDSERSRTPRVQG